MKKIKYRNFQPDDAPIMVEIQRRCLDISPDTGNFEVGFWFSPGFKEGKNIFIAEDDHGTMLGYAAISSAYYSNSIQARVLWMDLRTDPANTYFSDIKDALLDMIIQRGYEIKREEKRERAAIGATYFSQGQASIKYLHERGFTHFETMLAMQRNLSIPIPSFRCSPEIQIKSWKMETRPEKQTYLEAREIAFGYPLGRIDLLEHLTNSDLWRGGTTFTAFSYGNIVASVMVLSNGLLDYVFVIPEWRRKNIARTLISEALKYLEEQGHSRAWLEVLSHNEAAIRLYRGFGFNTFREEISLGYLLA